MWQNVPKYGEMRWIVRKVLNPKFVKYFLSKHLYYFPSCYDLGQLLRFKRFFNPPPHPPYYLFKDNKRFLNDKSSIRILLMKDNIENFHFQRNILRKKSTMIIWEKVEKGRGKRGLIRYKSSAHFFYECQKCQNPNLFKKI